MNTVEILPFSFTAIIQAETIREAFMDSVRLLQSNLIDEIELTIYGTSVHHISCCFILIPNSIENKEIVYENIEEYIEEENEIFLQICLDYEELLLLAEENYFSYLAHSYQQALIKCSKFEEEAFNWNNLLLALKELSEMEETDDSSVC